MHNNSIQDAHNYYLKYDEEKRVKQDRAHTVEYLFSMQTIEKYITPETDLIDIGCGTGNYSMALASKCHNVLATDLMDNLLKVLEEKIKKEGLSNISCLCANVLDIPQYINKKYDVVLCMGPLYHLNNMETRQQCYRIMKQLAKPDGVIIFTYLTTNAPFSGVLKGKFAADIFFNQCRKETYYQGAFYFTSPDYMNQEITDNGFEIIEHLATDPICCFCSTEINAMPEESYNIFIKTLSQNNDTPALLRLSAHNMIVARVHK